ncbi:MAG TPA: hypothetical protein VFD71_07510, partial [Planctomycetota bacterium]|nr:hypothetical protein [Planctomycetota bacterium]
MASIVVICAVLSVGQAESSAEISALLGDSPEARFLAQQVPQLTAGSCARLRRVSLDLVSSERRLSDPDDCNFPAVTFLEDEIGLHVQPSALEPLIPDGADINAVKNMLARLCAEKRRQFRIEVAFVPPSALEAAQSLDTPALSDDLDPIEFEAIVAHAGSSALRLT